MVETWKPLIKLDDVDTVLPQLALYNDLKKKNSLLSLAAIDAAWGLLMYYSWSCSSQGNNEIRSKYQFTRRIMTDDLVYEQPRDRS
jgi:hypothetical protein